MDLNSDQMEPGVTDARNYLLSEESKVCELSYVCHERRSPKHTSRNGRSPGPGTGTDEPALHQAGDQKRVRGEMVIALAILAHAWRKVVDKWHKRSGQCTKYKVQNTI